MAATLEIVSEAQLQFGKRGDLLEEEIVDI